MRTKYDWSTSFSIDAKYPKYRCLVYKLTRVLPHSFH